MRPSRESLLATRHFPTRSHHINPLLCWYLRLLICEILKSVILIVAATALEIHPLLQQYQQGKFPSSPDILISGIGLTATAFALTKQISIKRPDFVIQAGIAGSFDRSLPLGTVVAISKDCIADQGVTEKSSFKTIFDLQLAPANQFPYSKGWLVNRPEVLNKAGLKKVTAVSVNEITTSRKKIEAYSTQFNPIVESMEGAAMHYVCLMEGIPFLQIRSISNYIGERDKKKWKLKESVTNLNNQLYKLLNTI